MTDPKQTIDNEVFAETRRLLAKSAESSAETKQNSIRLNELLAESNRLRAEWQAYKASLLAKTQPEPKPTLAAMIARFCTPTTEGETSLAEAVVESPKMPAGFVAAA